MYFQLRDFILKDLQKGLAKIKIYQKEGFEYRIVNKL